MSPPRSFDVVAGRVADLAPVFREPLDSPYEISNALYAALRHVLHDVGGQPDLPVPFKEKVEEQWEMDTYVTCECLGWRGAWNSEERRRRRTTSARRCTSGCPTTRAGRRSPPRCSSTRGYHPDELTAKIDEVRARIGRSA